MSSLSCNRNENYNENNLAVITHSQWQHAPFAGTIVDDRIYGRGVADSKAALAKLSEGIALFIYFAKALKDSSQFNGSLFLGFEAQEESGSFSGIREILHHGVWEAKQQQPAK